MTARRAGAVTRHGDDEPLPPAPRRGGPAGPISLPVILIVTVSRCHGHGTRQVGSSDLTRITDTAAAGRRQPPPPAAGGQDAIETRTAIFMLMATEFNGTLRIRPCRASPAQAGSRAA